MPAIRTLALASTALALAAPAFAQDKTITIATHYNQDQMAPLTECFRAYEAEHPGIAIEHQQASYRDFLQTILTARVGGTSPDIYNIYSVWAPQLASAGVLMAPPEEVQAFVREATARARWARRPWAARSTASPPSCRSISSSTTASSWRRRASRSPPRPGPS